MYKNHLLKGALLLTAAGVFSRIIGFFYRIFLSRTFGAEQMGIYELISPVLALSFALCTLCHPEFDLQIYRCRTGSSNLCQTQDIAYRSVRLVRPFVPLHALCLAGG